jgi:two-component sensor histidine kinase
MLRASRAHGRGLTRRWSPYHGTVAQFLAIARDTTTEVTERQRAAAISAEMRHRLKNALTIAAGIVAISARSKPELQPFAQEVTTRFAQLASVQDLLLDPTREKHLADIVPLLASAYGDASLLRFGAPPEAQLGDGAMQALALAFGELATNSLKYGALKQGQPIDVDADIVDTMLQLTWREPTEFGASREGAQGLGLIERLVGASGGRVERAFDDGILLVRLWLPILR